MAKGSPRRVSSGRPQTGRPHLMHVAEEPREASGQGRIQGHACHRVHEKVADLLRGRWGGKVNVETGEDPRPLEPTSAGDGSLSHPQSLTWNSRAVSVCKDL
jgi:hypothetical protein